MRSSYEFPEKIKAFETIFEERTKRVSNGKTRTDRLNILIGILILDRAAKESLKYVLNQPRPCPYNRIKTVNSQRDTLIVCWPINRLSDANHLDTSTCSSWRCAPSSISLAPSSQLTRRSRCKIIVIVVFFFFFFFFFFYKKAIKKFL
jgi:hypothetical protein